jgi:hypothetical protein
MLSEWIRGLPLLRHAQAWQLQANLVAHFPRLQERRLAAKYRFDFGCRTSLHVSPLLTARIEHSSRYNWNRGIFGTTEFAGSVSQYHRDCLVARRLSAAAVRCSAVAVARQQSYCSIDATAHRIRALVQLGGRVPSRTPPTSEDPALAAGHRSCRSSDQILGLG